RGVLITVRLHLDGSALGPRLEEECKDDRPTTEIGKLNWSFEQPVLVGAGESEVRRDIVNRWPRRRSRRSCGDLLGVRY
ncbi:MAG TPA: hypothetical protein VHL32_00745, partial [Gemmatimonadaceae bacterium]|nr:hypothetical protein [Gemmatimonadaceae bacterium]